MKIVPLLLLFLSQTVVAQQAEIQPLASKSLLLDIQQSSSSLFAVGERGHVLVSDLGGNNWQQASVPTNSNLTAVFPLNEQLIWAVGHDATIIHSANGGETWQLQYQDIELEKPLMDVLFLDENNGLAVGAYGLFLKTVDGGKTWQKVLHDTLLLPDDIDYLAEIRQESEDDYQSELEAILPHLNKLKMIGNELWLVGEMGLVATSTNQGQTWQRQEEIYHGSFFDVQQVNEQVIVAGLRGNIFLQSSPENWESKQLPDAVSVNQILPLNDGFLVMANSAVIYQYNLQNASFSQLTKLTSKSQVAAITHNQQVFTVGENGVLTFSLSK